jgi:hypothetical protein
LLCGGRENRFDTVYGWEDEFLFVVCCVVGEWLFPSALDYGLRGGIREGLRGGGTYAGDMDNAVYALHDIVEDSDLGEIFDLDEFEL